MQDGATKQDCETNAGKRALHRIRAEHRQLPIIIVGDGLFSKGPFIQQLKQGRCSFLLVAKPKDHTSLFADIEGLRRGKLLERLVRTDNKGRQ